MFQMREYFQFPSYDLNIVSGRTMAEIDRIAIETRGTPGLFLMENAGALTAQGILADNSHENLQRIVILCGKGNNGGDGFVIARHMVQNGYSPDVALLGKADQLTGDARTNYLRLHELGLPIRECHNSILLDAFFAKTQSASIWVDAMLGTGARGAPRGLIAEAIYRLNEQPKKHSTIAVDIASGVDADTGRVEGSAVISDIVYTMGLPKIGHLLLPGSDYCKNLVVLDIGFPRDLLSDCESFGKLLSAKNINEWFPQRPVSSHKGREGHLLVIAGSRGMTGAALMCAKAAIHTGAGLVTTVCPESLLPIYASSVWEMMTLPVHETADGAIDQRAFEEIFTDDARWSAVVIGPGLGRHPSSQELVRRIVKKIELPLLIDGDGLFAVSPDILQMRQAPWVVTPHPGEMARLFNTDSASIQADRFGYAKKLVDNDYGAALLKGPKTVIAHSRGKIMVNPTGSPAMASGGMGDVLSGIIGALLSKKIDSSKAAACGAYIHGLSAELIEQEHGFESVTATQVIENIQLAISILRKWT